MKKKRKKSTKKKEICHKKINYVISTVKKDFLYIYIY